MNDHPVLAVVPLDFVWPTLDPFLFCVHHEDAYPPGNEQMGPATALVGRNLGQDFAGIDGWRMYHGEVVPGFPQHPHRGFETVTIVRRGVVDHSDSLGATARFAAGDVQWLTAGRGIVHSEMFPLRDRIQPNPAELFQIWLNLPAASKMAAPHFSMLWRHAIPEVAIVDEHGRKSRVTVVAGRWGQVEAPPPPPESWASHHDADVAIWTIAMDPGATLVIPPTRADVGRTLYAFRGEGVEVAGRAIGPRHGAQVRADAALQVVAGGQPTELLMLQGRPIGEPVAQHGPFVMNTRAEIEQAFADYRSTRFGGWPWPSDGPVHAREDDRFARHADGCVERPQ